VLNLLRRHLKPVDPIRTRSGGGNGKAANAPPEHNEQAVFIEWLDKFHPKVRAMTCAVPNGTHKRSMASRMKHRKEGLTPGYPDVLIDYPCGPYHGLRVEMKRRAKSLSGCSDAQYLWKERLTMIGYRSVICYGADEAIAEAEQYLNLGPFSITAWLRFWHEDDQHLRAVLAYLEEERA